MVSDAMKQDTTDKRVIASTHSDAAAFELTRLASFVDGEEDIFDILARQGSRYQDDNALQKAVEATICVLKNAQNVIDKQSRRIQKLEHMRIYDELTGLLNGKGFYDALKREAARLRRKQNQHNIFITVQLENLMSIEHAHGAQAAEMAVKLLGYSLEQEARATDICARTEDDEFVLLYVDTSPESSIARIQELNLNLNKLSFVWNEVEITLHISLSIKRCDSSETLESQLEYYQRNDFNVIRSFKSEVMTLR